VEIVEQVRDTQRKVMGAGSEVCEEILYRCVFHIRYTSCSLRNAKLLDSRLRIMNS
jgi:hypothetical protein